MYGTCSLPSISAPGLENEVRNQISEQFAITRELRMRATQLIEEESEAARSAADRQRVDLIKALERHQDRRLALARRLLGDASELISPDMYRRLEDEEVAAIRRIETELAILPEERTTLEIEPILSSLSDMTWTDLSWEGWRQVITLLVDRILLRDRGDFEIRWHPAADLLRRALSKVSRDGSRTFG
jgi:hypothetical protein